MTDEGRNSAFGLLNLAMDHALLLVAVPLLTALFGFAFATMQGPLYRAQSVFTPESSTSSVGELGGLATQLGFGAGLLQSSESVEFYARLATSRAALEALASRRYRFAVKAGAPDTLEGTIPELMNVEAENEAERLRIGAGILSEWVQADVDRSASLVTIFATAPWAPLAVELNRAALDAVSTFNREQRRSSAAAERAFVQEQLEQARADLKEAEDALGDFLEANRRYQNLPELRFEAERLQRRVDLVEQLYTSLAQSLQQARIEEVRNTPTITVISPPENSAEKVTSRARTTVLAFILGLALVVGYILLKEFGARHRERAPAEYEGFRTRLTSFFRRS